MAFKVKLLLLVCLMCQLHLLKMTCAPTFHYIIYKLGNYDKQYGIKIIVAFNLHLNLQLNFN
jgi:hypothetical protein